MIGALLLAASAAAPPAPPSMATMRHARRVLIVAASGDHDPALIAQRRLLASWAREAAARDMTIVEMVGDAVTGAADGASVLRRTYRLSGDGFTAILIGKDGHEAFRSHLPVTTAVLQARIDAMPMRRAGGR